VIGVHSVIFCGRSNEKRRVVNAIRFDVVIWTVLLQKIPGKYTKDKS